MCGEERAIRASNSDHEKSTALRPGPFRERGLTGRLPERLAGLRRSNEPPPKVDDDAEPTLERVPQPAADRSSRVVCASPPSDVSGLKVTAPRRSLRWRRAASDESVRRADASDGAGVGNDGWEPGNPTGGHAGSDARGLGGARTRRARRRAGGARSRRARARTRVCARGGGGGDVGGREVW